MSPAASPTTGSTSAAGCDGFSRAVTRGDSGTVRDLSPDCLGDPAGRDAQRIFFFAARGLHADVVTELMADGVNPDIRDGNGLTAAFAAATPTTDDAADRESRRLRTVRVLVDGGADLGATADDGLTLVQSIAGACYPRILRFILDEDDDLGAQRGFELQTPLMSAAKRGRTACVDVLRSEGVDPTLTDSRGRTAADLATAAGYDELADTLE